MEQKNMVVQSRLWDMVQSNTRKRILKARKSAPTTLQSTSAITDGDEGFNWKKVNLVRSETAPAATLPSLPISLRPNRDGSPTNSITELVACIEIGNIYSSAGYSWKDSAGTISHRILDIWTACKHCPEENQERILSDLVLEKSSGKFLAMGYEAHKKYLNSTPRQRKRLMYLTGFANIFSRENLDDSVTDGTAAVNVTYGLLCASIIRKFRQEILTDMDRQELLHPDLQSFTWCASVQDKQSKMNMESVMTQLQMQKIKVVLTRDATAMYLASIVPTPSLQSPSSTLSLRRKETSGSQAFVTIQIGAATIKSALILVTGNVVAPLNQCQLAVGSQTINVNLYNFLVRIFGGKMLETYKEDNFEGHLDLLCAIEKSKRLAEQDEHLALHLPFSFATHFQKKCKGKLAKYAQKVGCTWNEVNNSILIPYKNFSVHFIDVTNKIAETVKEVLEDRPAGLQIKNIPIYITGGFGESLLLQTLVDQVLAGFRVVFPVACRQIGLMGAMKAAIESPNAGFRTRQSLFTIGMTVAAHCDTHVLGHLPVTKIVDLQDAFFCNAFVPFIRKEDNLYDSHHTVERHFFAASPSQESILVRIFFATEVLEKTIFEDLMENVAELRLHVPKSKRGITTGKLFIFHVLLQFETEPEGVLISVEDDEGVAYGTCRILRQVTF